MDEVIEKFISFLEHDVNLINQGLQKDHPRLIQNIEKDEDWLYFETYSFIDIASKYCFQSVSVNDDYFNNYIPEYRLSMFRKIFLSGVEKAPPFIILGKMVS